MNDDQIKKDFDDLRAEIDMLRARNDVLMISLKYAVLATPNPTSLLQEIISRLRDTSTRALFSSQPSDAYLTAFDGAAARVEKWLEALPHAEQ
ncbi:hypothetical protein WJ21_16690 [Burkholderia vietnamiensis]|uniref:hypothetical protein n=1 Tax=Burkholderia vietnamiensis TaxID=60552 RepID=UPI00075CC54D|nr:hypothetical protein [Burkholderia vietnamiensis]KVF97006.1 hypothetical protein WJ21_16690 [Burkholderia vietnamiensis]